jgi:hypothetical protein
MQPQSHTRVGKAQTNTHARKHILTRTHTNKLTIERHSDQGVTAHVNTSQGLLLHARVVGNDATSAAEHNEMSTAVIELSKQLLPQEHAHTQQVSYKSFSAHQKATATHLSERVCVPPPHETEQADQGDADTPYVPHGCTKHDDEVAGSTPPVYAAHTDSGSCASAATSASVSFTSTTSPRERTQSVITMPFE